ncbi:transmembrane channel-like protein 1 [Tachysurus ichikawai]
MHGCIFLIFLEQTYIHTGTKLLMTTMPREKLIALESDVSIDVDEGDINDSVYYVGIDVDGKKQREEMDKKKKERKLAKGQSDKVQKQQKKSTYLHNCEKNRINGAGDVEEIPMERKNSKNKKAAIQQEESEGDGEEKKMKMMQGNNNQSKKKEKVNKMATERNSSADESFVDSLNLEEQEKLMKAIEEKKKLIATLKTQNWPMHKKLSTLRESQAFIEKNEGTLGQVKGKKLYTYNVMVMKKWVKFKRNFNNFKKACIPWEGKIKKIESHFGSAVASYFIFLRWMFGMNIILFVLSFGLVMFPEAIIGLPYGSIPRKTVFKEELPTASNFDILWDLEGYIKYSVMFYGYYNNERTIGWIKFRMPLCFLLVALCSIAYSYMEIIRIMVHNESKGSGGDDTHFNYSWTIFTSWDYLVGNPETADINFASIATTFKESLIEEKELRKKEDIRWTIFYRILSNIMVFSILVGSGYLIYFVVHRSEKFFRAGMYNFNWWERNEVNAVMSLLTTFCPMFFEAIALIENYHPRISLHWQLARIFALYVGNLYSFVIAIIEQINISRVQEEEMKYNLTIFEANMYNRSIAENSTIPHVDPADVPRGPCWETIVGQEFVRMVISDTLTIYIVLLVNDFLRAIVIRVFNSCWCWDLEYTFPNYALFDLSGNVLTLIFNQGMICMGSLFAPCLPALNVLRLQTSMYIQAWGVLCCNIPHPYIFKNSRHSNFYMYIQLFILFVSTLPTIFAIVYMRPSFDCGPFSGKDYMYDVITESLELDFPRWFRNVVSYVLNPGVVVPLVLFMVLTLIYLHSTSKTYKKANNDLKKKLRDQCEENRKKGKLEAKKSAEYLEQIKNMAATEQDKVKQSNSNVSGKGVRDNSKRSRESGYFPTPRNVYSGSRGSSLKYSHKPPCTRPPSARSHLLHGQLPGYLPH